MKQGLLYFFSHLFIFYLQEVIYSCLFIYSCLSVHHMLGIYINICNTSEVIVIRKKKNNSNLAVLNNVPLRIIILLRKKCSHYKRSDKLKVINLNTRLCFSTNFSKVFTLIPLKYEVHNSRFVLESYRFYYVNISYKITR